MKNKKFLIVFLLTALVSLSTLSTDIYLPALPKMVSFFNTTTTKAQLTLSIYMLGFAFSMLFCGPLSDRYGRKPVVLVGIGLHLISTFCCLFSPTIEVFIVARFFQALGGCCGTVLGRVIARDLFKEKECIKVLSYLSAGLAISLIVAPIIGGGLQTFFDWRSNFIVLAILSGIIFISSYYLLNETLAPQSRKVFYFQNLFRDYSKVIRNRHFLGYTFAITFAWCGYFSFISGSSFIFIDLMNITPQYYAMLYAIIIIGYILGTLLASRMSNQWSPEQSVFFGAFLTLIGGVCMAILTFIFPLNMFIIMFPMFFYLIGTGLIMPNAQAVVTNPFPNLIGSASSLFYFIEMFFGALVGGVVGIYLEQNQSPMIIAIFISSVFLFISFYQLIWKKNLSIRQKF